jgi:hypothetical protein
MSAPPDGNRTQQGCRTRLFSGFSPRHQRIGNAPKSDLFSAVRVHSREENAVTEIREHMKVIGKDGAHVGIVDRVEGNRIKLTRKDSPAGHQDHHHFIDRALVGSVEGDVVKLSLNADAVPKTEQSGKAA